MELNSISTDGGKVVGKFGLNEHAAPLQVARHGRDDLTRRFVEIDTFERGDSKMIISWARAVNDALRFSAKSSLLKYRFRVSAAFR